MLRIISALLICLSSFSIYGQTISGKVTDQGSKPIGSVTLHLLNTNVNAVTNASGNYTISSVSPGHYIIELSAVGFATSAQQINVAPAGSSNLNFTLQSSMRQLDAVTVTAEKKEELLQHIPSSVTVLNSRQVQEFRLWDAKELTAIVPNLYSGNSGDQRNVTSIRGIATTSYDPAVVTYIDGVNQFSLDTYISQLLDIERIEILRGPQGTLYGRNAMGGVINIITKQPTNRADAFAEISIGDFGEQRYSAGIRFPLVKNKLFFGASGMYEKGNGYYFNNYTNSSFDKHQSVMGNYFLKYIPNPKWSAIINVKNQNNKNDGTFPLVNGTDEAFQHPFQLNQNAVGTMTDNTFDASLAVSHKGSSVDITTQLAWQHNYRFYNAPLDGDFSPLDAVSIINNYGKPWNNVRALTHELRFSSATNLSSKLNWTAGTYFFNQYIPNKQATHFGNDAALIGAPDTDFSTISSTKGTNTGIALFGQINYNLTNRLQLIAGLRYDYENKKLEVEGEYQKDGQPSFVTANDTTGSVNFSAVSPKLALQYLLSDASNIHVSYTRGYRTGGLTQLSPDPSQPPLYPYKPEYSNNIEAGIKNNLLNDRLGINITLFLTYVNNAQVPTLVLPDAITVTKNTGSLTSKGAEAEISLKPVNGLMVDYSFGYTDATYSSLKVSSNGQAEDLDGKKQIYTPDITSMLALQYSFTIAPVQQIRVVARGEWFYLGTQYFDLANNIRQSPYNRFNIRAGINSRHIDLFFWMRNISNTKYIEYAYDFGAVHLGNPETKGVTATFRL
jgi:iron complex outermembrane receptor protein